MPTGRNLAAGAAGPLIKRIHAEFPQLQWRDAQFIDHGWDHEVIILDQARVFRFPNSTAYRNVFSDEVKLLKFLATKSKSLFPHYELVAKDGSFAGYRLIPGAPLAHVDLQNLPVRTQTSIVTQIAQFLTDLHAIPLSELRPFNIAAEMPNDWISELGPGVDKYLKPVLSAPEYEQTLGLLRDLDTIDASKYRPVLTHGDLSQDHIIFDPQLQTVGFIDFSDRAVDDPAGDFAGLHYYGPDFVAQVYEHYRGRKDPQFLYRANLYYRRSWLHMLEDSFVNDKISFEDAKSGWRRALANTTLL